MARKHFPAAHAEGDDSDLHSFEPAPAPVEAEPFPSPSAGAETVKVMLLCDHVYLPEDPTAEDWETARVTMRYDGKTEDGRRSRVDVHPSLAAFLQGRSQAEILD